MKCVVIPIWIRFTPNPRKVFLSSVLTVLGAWMDSFSGDEFKCKEK